MDFIEKYAKTVDEAINEALKEFKITKEEAVINILDEGAKGFLGIGARPVHVKVSRKFNPEKMARDFIKEVTLLMGLVVNIETELLGNRLEIELSGDDLGILIGKRGQTLDSLQQLVSLSINKGQAPYVAISIDTGEYRKKRRETLETLAKSIARKARGTKRSVTLEPMTPYERRIIHAVLQNERDISTYSQGKEPFRSVVVTPKGSKKHA